MTALDYRMSHRAPCDPDYDAPAHDLTVLADADLMYGRRRWTNDPHVRECLDVCTAARNNPNAPVTIYRAAPAFATHINTGDWVTLSEGYARTHAGHGYAGDRPHILRAQVPAWQVFTDGNSFAEWGYAGPPVAG